MSLEIDLLAVGNGIKSGDAILLRYGDLDKGGDYQSVILIDGGYKNTAEDIKTILRKYYNCQNSKGKYVIDLMILSHPDSDHVGGLKALSEDPEIEIGKLLMHKPWDVVKLDDFNDGRMTHRSLKNRVKESFQTAFELYENVGASKYIPANPGCFTFGGASFTILGPSEELYRRKIIECPKTPDAKIIDEKQQKCFSQYTDEEEFLEGQEIEWDYSEYTSAINETSLVILFEYEGHKILLTGDAGKENLNEAIDFAVEKGIDLENIDIIKMPHHGSRKNVDPDIMNWLGKQGTRCYISCVSGDEGHHPSKRLVNMLKQKGFKVLTTSGYDLHRGYGSPDREGYRPATALDYFPTMDTL